MVSKLASVAVAISILPLEGCGMNGFVVASPDDQKIIDAGGFSEAATAQIAIVQHPDSNGGKIPPEALREIQRLSMSCQVQIGPQLAGRGQAAGTGAINGAIPGLGQGPAASVATFANSPGRALDYSKYGGVASAGFGAFNGMQNGSYALVSAIGNCTRDFWQYNVKRNPKLEGTYVQIAYYSKRSGNSAPPALDRQAIAPSSPQAEK